MVFEKKPLHFGFWAENVCAVNCYYSSTGNTWTWCHAAYLATYPQEGEKYTYQNGIRDALHISGSYFVTTCATTLQSCYWIKSTSSKLWKTSLHPKYLPNFFSHSRANRSLFTIHYSTTYGQKPHKAALLILRRRVIYFLWHVKIIKQGGGRDFERTHLLPPHMSWHHSQLFELMSKYSYSPDKPPSVPVGSTNLHFVISRLRCIWMSAVWIFLISNGKPIYMVFKNKLSPIFRL